MQRGGTTDWIKWTNQTARGSATPGAAEPPSTYMSVVWEYFGSPVGSRCEANCDEYFHDKGHLSVKRASFHQMSPFSRLKKKKKSPYRLLPCTGSTADLMERIEFPATSGQTWRPITASPIFVRPSPCYRTPCWGTILGCLLILPGEGRLKPDYYEALFTPLWCFKELRVSVFAPFPPRRLLPQLRPVLCALTATEVSVDPKKGGKHYVPKKKNKTNCSAQGLEVGLFLKNKNEKTLLWSPSVKTTLEFVQLWAYWRMKDKKSKLFPATDFSHYYDKRSVRLTTEWLVR